MSIVLCAEDSLRIRRKKNRKLIKQLMEEMNDRFSELRLYRKQ